MATKEPCPRCRSNGRDQSGDNLLNYGEGKGAFCWSCGFTVLSDDERAKRGLDEYEYNDEEVMSKEILMREELEKIKSYTGTTGKGSRNIPDTTYDAYKVRFTYDDETGDVAETYYPYTEGFVAAGFKVRKIPKDFYSVGRISKEGELFGQWKWKAGGGKYLVITSGEADCLAAYTMLENYRKERNSDFDPIPCVTSGIGESGSWKQIQAQYEWIDTYERIVVFPDMDEAGQKALKKLFEVMPKGKMFVAKLPLKDVNKMLDEGKQKQFIHAFYDAQPYSPAGIVGSGELSSKMREEVSNDRIAFPPFMSEVNKMLGGGLGIGKICNIGAGSGLGKTTYVDEIVYHMLFHSPYQVGVVSMELNAGQYGVSMLSRHCGVKINNIEDKDERLAFLNRPEVMEKERELFYREDGTHRFHLVEERDGSVEELQKLVEQLVIACDCKLIVLDPLQDILDGLSIEDQAMFLKWQKGLLKSHKVTFININHVRKSGGGSGNTQNSQGAMISEEDFAGSSTIFKSAAANILLVRNKMAEDPIERNTTKAYLSKNRDNSITGPCGEYYYDSATHKLWNKQEWLMTQPVDFQ